MPCALTSNYVLDCRDSRGGISEIHFAEKRNIYVEDANGVVTVIWKLTPFRKYELPDEVGSLTETKTTNTQNGTVFYQTEIKLVVNKLAVAVRNEVKLLAQNTLYAIVKDNNGRYWFLGRYNGVDLTSGTLGTGTAYGDRSGFDLTFTATEASPMFGLSDALAPTINVLTSTDIENYLKYAEAVGLTPTP